jgi:pilus assembly protein Flp/PilA
MRKLLKRFYSDQSGAAAIEYALIAGMIACAVIHVLTTVGTKLAYKFNEISGNLT